MTPAASGEGPAFSEATWHWKALDVATRIAFPFLLGVAGWASFQLVDLRERVRVIEATSLTSKEANAAHTLLDAASLARRDELTKSRRDLVAVLGKQSVALARIETSLDGKAERLQRIELELAGLKDALRDK